MQSRVAGAIFASASSGVLRVHIVTSTSISADLSVVITTVRALEEARGRTDRPRTPFLRSDAEWLHTAGILSLSCDWKGTCSPGDRAGNVLLREEPCT